MKAPPAIRLAPPLDRALAQLTRGAEGNGANLGAVECRALLTALSSEREAGEKLRERMAQMVETHNRTITYREGVEGLPPGTIPRWTAPSTETPR